MRRRVRRSAQHHAALISLGLAMIAFQPGGAAGAQTPSIVQSSATSADDAATLQTQAHLLYRQGKYTDAEPLFRRALETFRAVLGEQHPCNLT